MKQPKEGLTLTFEDEFDGMGTLSAAVSAGGFSGVGRACFGVAELRSFAEDLERLSHSLQGPPEVQGGYHGTDGAMQTVLVALRALPLDALGQIALRVELADQRASNERLREERRVVTYLETQPEALIRFARHLTDFVEGKRPEAHLACG